MTNPTELAAHLFLTGQASKAITLIEPYIASNPTDAYALGILAGSLYAVGRPADGLAAGLRAVTLEPNNINALITYAECLARSGEFATARTVGARAVRLAPNDIEAHKIFAIALAAVNEFDLAYAEAYAAQQLADPDDAAQASIHMVWSSVLEHWPGRFASSLEQAHLAVERMPSNDLYRTRLARLHLVDKKPWRAIRTATDVLSAAPTTSGVRGTLLLALQMLHARLLWAQFAVAIVTPMIALGALGGVLGVSEDGAPAARVGALISLSLTALLLFLLLRGAPIGRRLVRTLWNTLRKFPGAVIALGLQCLVVVFAFAGLITGGLTLILFGWPVVVLASIAFRLSQGAMLRAGIAAYGLPAADLR